VARSDPQRMGKDRGCYTALRGYTQAFRDISQAIAAAT